MSSRHSWQDSTLLPVILSIKLWKTSREAPGSQAQVINCLPYSLRTGTIFLSALSWCAVTLINFAAFSYLLCVTHSWCMVYKTLGTYPQSRHPREHLCHKEVPQGEQLIENHARCVMMSSFCWLWAHALVITQWSCIKWVISNWKIALLIADIKLGQKTPFYSYFTSSTVELRIFTCQSQKLSSLSRRQDSDTGDIHFPCCTANRFYLTWHL